MGQPGYPTTTTTTITASGSAKHNHYTARTIALDCLKVVLFVIAITLLFALIPCVSYVLKLLQPSPPQVRVNSSSLSILNVSAHNDITANWNVTFSVKNPNRHDMFFDEIKAWVLHEKESLLNTTLMPFEVGTKNQTTIKTRFASLLVHVDGCNMNKSAALKPCGVANLSVELQAKAKYGGWTWPIKRDVIKVECASNTTTPCSVHGRWETIRNTSSTIFFFSTILLFILAVSLL